MSKLDEYLDLQLQFVNTNDRDVEDALIQQLDKLWRSMTPEQRQVSRLWGSSASVKE